MGELLAVAALRGVVPEVRPARRRPAFFTGERAQEVGLRLQPRPAQVRPVRVRPLDRVPQHGDEPGVWEEVPDAALGRGS